MKAALNVMLGFCLLSLYLLGDKQYGAVQNKDKMLQHVDQMWHVLVAEDGNEKICAELIQWMDNRYAKSS